MPEQSASEVCFNSGVDLFAVGKVLGHASVQSTQRYSHLANDTLLKAVEAGAANLIFSGQERRGGQTGRLTQPGPQLVLAANRHEGAVVGGQVIGHRIPE